MTGRLFKNFFPSIFQNTVGRSDLFSSIFQRVMVTCPDATIHVPMSFAGVDTIRNPALAVSAAVGVLIGIGLSLEIFISKRRPGLSRSASSDHIIWSAAFLCFGLMNVIGLAVHCVLGSPPDDKSYADVHPHWWIIDTTMTGVSSSCLLFGGVNVCLSFWPRMKNYAQPWLDGLRWVLVAYFVLSFSSFVFLPQDVCMTLPLESWYLVPMMLAAPPIFFMLFILDLNSPNESTDGQIRVARMVYMFGISLLVLGLFDRRLYHLSVSLGEYFGKDHRFGYDMLTLQTAVFSACDIYFVGIYLWIKAACEAHDIASKRNS